MNKWKTAFIISTSITLLVIATGAYVVFANSLTSGHCKDNQLIINEDINHVIKAFSNGAETIEQIDSELTQLNVGHWTEIEFNQIRLQIVILQFDKSGKFQSIEF